MRHIDPESLALEALGEPVLDAAEAMHLQHCSVCASTLAELKATAEVGRAARSAEPMLTPSARVWDGIAAELGLSNHVRPERAGDPEPPVRGEAAPVVDIESARGRRHRLGGGGQGPERRRFVIGGLAVAAAAVIVGVIAVNLARPTLGDPAPRVLAEAELAAFPDWPQARGDAVLQVLPDGTRQLSVRLDAEVAEGDDREVWLIRSDASDLVSLGLLTGGSGVFEVPDEIDPEEFNLVDVSDEPRDGDPTHSGNSIVRGPLA